MAVFKGTSSHRRGKGYRRKVEPYRVNDKIMARVVRLVGDNVNVDVYQVDAALKIAREQGLDLVEISSNVDPPICKIIDYSKFKYEQKKKKKEIKARTQKVVLKEIRFGPNTDDHDFNFKLRHAINFLKEGAKVKPYVYFPGRSIVHKERGETLLLKFAQLLEDYGRVEYAPALDRKRMHMIIIPKGKK